MIDWSRRLRQFAISGAVLGALCAAAGAAVYFLGLYDIAATTGHSALVYTVLHGAMKQAVHARSRGIRLPDLSDPARARRGFVLYQAHCVQCHGGPGVEPDALAYGLMPAPANLVEAAREWTVPALYSVIRHGVKMTAMPAWEYRLNDEQLWDLTAFVQAMPKMAPQEYRQQVASLQIPPAVARVVPERPAVRPGDAARGREALGKYLCATCHRIPDVAGAVYDVGPPLGGIARRRFIAGVLPNTRENMVRWLRAPVAVDPRSGMPDLHVTEQDAYDLAAFLDTLGDGR
jgi:mono/diheme cytochrome c family protein